jgi:hypothetical protein
MEPNQTVSRGVYGTAIRQLPIPEDFIAAQAARIDSAYEAGEPLWMICDEMMLRYQHRPQHSLTPHEAAIRVVRV